MTLLIAGLLIFFGIHLLPFTSLKPNLKTKLGEMRYKAIYSIISAAGFISIIVGMINSEFIHLWLPPTWGKHFAMTLMLPALILLVASHAPSNIKRVTRHPMLWGITLWALAHLAANGDQASLLLFGSFAIYSLFAMWLSNRRGLKKSKQVYPASKTAKLIVIGVVLYGILLFAHPYFTGVTLVAV